MTKELEIGKILTLSTAHIDPVTAHLLDDCDTPLTVYDKANYGWFIYVAPECDQEDLGGCPEELLELVKLARNNDCTWLCLDRDGEIAEGLPVFDW